MTLLESFRICETPEEVIICRGNSQRENDFKHIDDMKETEHIEDNVRSRGKLRKPVVLTYVTAALNVFRFNVYHGTFFHFFIVFRTRRRTYQLVWISCYLGVDDGCFSTVIIDRNNYVVDVLCLYDLCWSLT